jgi:hypothetical protein
LHAWHPFQFVDELLLALQVRWLTLEDRKVHCRAFEFISNELELSTRNKGTDLLIRTGAPQVNASVSLSFRRFLDRRRAVVGAKQSMPFQHMMPNTCFAPDGARFAENELSPGRFRCTIEYETKRQGDGGGSERPVSRYRLLFQFVQRATER